MVEKHVLREEDDAVYSEFDTLQRVFLRVQQHDCMAYHPRDVDISVLDTV